MTRPRLTRRPDGLYAPTKIVNGHRITGYGKTQSAALRNLEAKVQRARGGLPARDTALTFGEYAAAWVEATLAASNRMPATQELYAGMVRAHLIPALGGVRLANLAAHHLHQVVNSMREGSGRGKPYAPSTVGVVVMAAKAVTSDAAKDKLMAADPFASVKIPPRAALTTARYLDSEESARLLDAVRGDRLEALWLLLLGTGLRRGEAIGLRWEDISGEMLTVRRTIRRIHGKGLHIGPPKADSGRTVALPRFIVTALAEHRKRQLMERLAVTSWADDGIVFPSTVGTWLEPRGVNYRLAKLTKEAGLTGVHPHTLRHSVAAVLLTSGTPLAAVAAQLGHRSSAVTAMIYEHVLTSAKVEMAAKLDAVFGNEH